LGFVFVLHLVITNIKRGGTKNDKRKNYFHESSPTCESDVGYEPLVTTIPVRGINLVTYSHTRVESTTSVSHVGNDSLDTMSHAGGRILVPLWKYSLTSTCPLVDESSTIASHIGGISLVANRHTRNESTTSMDNVGNGSLYFMIHDGEKSGSPLKKVSLTFASHVGELPLATTSHVGGNEFD